jgi:hypothetical protein
MSRTVLEEILEQWVFTDFLGAPAEQVLEPMVLRADRIHAEAGPLLPPVVVERRKECGAGAIPEKSLEFDA